MTGEELRQIRTAMGLSQAALAERLGVRQNSLARWESGQKWRGGRRISEPIARLIRQIKLHDDQQKIFSSPVETP